MIGSVGVALSAARGHVAGKPSKAASAPNAELNDGQVFFGSAILIASVLVAVVFLAWLRRCST